MRTVELNGYIDEEAWFGDEVTPESLHALLYPEGADAQEDLRIIHESPDIPGSPLAIQKDLPQELKDKVKDLSGAAPVAGMPEPGGPSASGNASQAVGALVALGYSASEAAAAVGRLDSALPPEELIRLALKSFGSGK